MMKTTLMMLTIGGVLAAAIASAHPGATGVVRERMDGMMAMERAVRDLTPIMRGQVAYDRQAVIDAAAVIQSHSGETMTTLFPEGSDTAVSAARPEVWENWEDFEALAMRMEVVASALAEAVDNPPGSSMLDAGDQADAGTLMGGTSSMMGGATTMMGGTAEPDAVMLARMPIDRVFAMAAQTCSACHTAYRVETDD